MSWIEAIRRSTGRVDLRVAATLASTFAPLIGAVIFLFYAYAVLEALEEIDWQAQRRFDEIERMLAGDRGSDPSEMLASVGSALAAEGIGVELLDPTGKVQARGGTLADPGRLRLFEDSLLAGVLVPGQDFLRYARDLPSGARTVVTVSLAHFAEERAELALVAWICAASGLSAAALLALFATRRAMAPLRNATQSIDRIDAAQLDARLPLRGTSDDVDRHSAAVNRVLARLEAAFVRMSAFSSDVAHELRTPLNRILSLTDVALMAPGDAQARSALEPIRDTADEMGRLVEGLLMLSRGERGQLALSLERVSVAELLSDLERLYAPACDERGIQLELGAASGTLRADRTLLFRALANLLDNAIRFTPRGGRIHVEATPAAAGVSIRVCDSGRGIPAGEREAVFERFTRLDPARNGPGTGLGLPIARMIARAHRGDLVVSDSPLGGACFSLGLPAEF